MQEACHALALSNNGAPDRWRRLVASAPICALLFARRREQLDHLAVEYGYITGLAARH